MALKAGRVGVHPDDVDLNGHIKNNGGGGDLSAYVKKTDAPGYNDILTQTSASSTYLTQSSATSNYQEKLVSGTNIKTINGNSLLGSGDLEIGGGGGGDLSAYVKKVDAPGYADILTQTSASSTYQTQSGMSAYQTVSGMSAYQTVSGMSAYQTVSGMSAYQTVADMTNYVSKSEAVGYNDILTQTSASSTYQTQSGMSAYQTVNGMSSYVAKSEAVGYNDILTTTNASTLYQPKLISGVNVKTINSESILGSGNLVVGGVLGGIDTSNVIASNIDIKSSTPYTATEDCWLVTTTARAGYLLDGVVTFSFGNNNAKMFFPLKKGQTFATASSSTSNADVYGVKL